MMNSDEIKKLKKFAARIRIETLKEIARLGSGHIGGTLSMAELLAVLYGKQLNVDPANPKKEDRDFLVTSKGHAGPAVYAALAISGFFPMEWLATLNLPGTRLPSHTDKNFTPGVDMTTGALGQGGSAALGIAIGNRLKGLSNYTYCVVGDGEMDEGEIWEMMLIAPHYKVKNFIVIVDNNKQQLDGFTKDIMDLGDISEKARAFGWFVVDCDGHDVSSIDEAIEQCKQSDRPSFINMHTEKGKGWDVCEGKCGYHHVRGLSLDDVSQVCNELEQI